MKLWLLLLAAAPAALCQEFLHLGAANLFLLILYILANNHPADGPDLSGHLARSLIDDQLLSENEVETPDALVDPDGRKFIAPLKTNSVQYVISIPQDNIFFSFENERRKEQEEITRILETAKKPSVSWNTWLWSMFGCLLVISCGVVPAFLLPINTTEYLHTPGEALPFALAVHLEGKRKLNLMLSFAVGSLLGDVFLHLLPETWSAYNGTYLLFFSYQFSVDMFHVGIWTIAGLLVCFFVEKLCASTEESQHKVRLVDYFT